MKKLLVITLLLVYGFSSMGMSIHLHYCCGKLKDIALSPLPAEKCGMKHKMKSGKCCESKEVSNKDFSDQDHVQLFAKSIKAPAEGSRYYELVFSGRSAIRRLSTIAFAPPPLSSQPLHLLHCVFRI